MKKVICIVLALIFVLSFAACGGSGSNTPAPANSPAASPASGGGTSDGGYAGGEYNLKIATYFSGKQGGGEFAQKFADKVGELSDGKIKVDVYQDSQLGSQSELVEALTQGTMDFCPNDWAMMDTVLGYGKGAIIGFPFIFKDWDNVKAFWGSDTFATMKQELLDNYGVRCLGMAADGFRQIYSQKPINSVEDLKGLKLRLPDISVYIETFQALGAATTIVPRAELYTALQNGTVNALERPADGMYSNNLYEQTSYVIKTDHIFVDVGLFASEAVFSKLDADAQAVILQAGQECADEHFEYMRGRDQDSLNKLVTECKQELIELDTTEMREICQSTVWPKFLEKIDGGQAIVDAIQACAK
ncbi:MAG: TRAP transporter substrate-binding protein [Oscillospiraceae bacterium]|nr:TRAP transporter substrate-binding protein [Oscillospiraceae bacterium]